MTMLNDTGLSMAQRFKVARTIAGMKQEDVARAVGVTRQAVGEWESGRTEPSASKLVLLAHATHQSLDWFAEGMRAWRDSNPQPSDLELDADFWRIVGHDQCQEWLDAHSLIWADAS